MAHPEAGKRWAVASAVAPACNGGLGPEPPAGPLVRESGGQSPPKRPAKSNSYTGGLYVLRLVLF